MFTKSEEIDIAPFIDHSLLLPAATLAGVEKVCYEAERFGFASVCVYPVHVRQAAELLSGRAPKVGTVIGFPTGATTSSAKLYEAQEAVENGAVELDVVINLGWVKQGDTHKLHQEIAEICEATGQTVKAVLEMAILSEAEQQTAVEACLDAGIAFFKTHTGWFGGASVADVRQLKQIAGESIGIKASGGIRSRQQATELILAGATRIGTSRGPEMMRDRGILEE
ncbi:MAG: deoxyribose-phosphate aldolase [Leptolyngbyaceae cyanobacterium SM1_1_3]|nr:deoxyribose-phosphate aldolase [Leptolyngbyaceae cyanobacterium SM1_1_3]NJN01616.1 deoxyribose-phosphate aldolase [Leptolyngbyaceae cyanobacterium RM1_1_2]NJO09861.1 deoxyribose-phosphate aldolase [Leptolyngbyaceae cyanobacterium SL_1_1]